MYSFKKEREREIERDLRSEGVKFDLIRGSESESESERVYEVTKEKMTVRMR